VGKNLGGAIIPHGWGAQVGKGLRRGLPMTLVDPRQPNEMAQSYFESLSFVAQKGKRNGRKTGICGRHIGRIGGFFYTIL
jgi:hypothetical protein